MSEKLIKSAKSDVSKALGDTYQVDGSGFEARVRHARRYLPWKAKQQADYLIQAEKDLKHPKLHKRVDAKKISQARKGLLRQTQGADPARDRSRARYGWASGLVINLLLATAVFYGILRWIGAI